MRTTDCRGVLRRTPSGDRGSRLWARCRSQRCRFLCESNPRTHSKPTCGRVDGKGWSFICRYAALVEARCNGSGEALPWDSRSVRACESVSHTTIHLRLSSRETTSYFGLGTK